MTLSGQPIIWVDILGSAMTLVLASLSLKRSWSWSSKKKENIFRHYVFLITAAFVVFAISRSFGHLVKQILIHNEMRYIWKQVSPFSGAINTATFITIFAVGIYFHRSRKIHQEIEHHKDNLEKLVIERSAQLAEKSSFLESTFESLNHPFYVIDPETHAVLMANAAAGFDLGHGGTCFGLSHNRKKPCTTENHPCPIKDILKTKKPVTVEHVHHNPDGSVGIHEVHAYPILDQEGDVDKIIEYTLDITKRKKSEEQIKEYAEVQKTLLREVNHRVKNNLSSIISMLYMEEERLGEDASNPTMSILNDLITRIRSLATVHSLLSASEWRPLSLNCLCHEIINGAFSTIPRSKQIAVDIQPSPIQVNSTQAHNLAIIINELTTNTFKHSLENNDLIEIRVTMDKTNDGDDVLINICYQDNGPGYPWEIISGNLEHANIGIELIHGIITTTLAGKVEFSNNQGAIARISFKDGSANQNSQAEI